MIQEKSDAKIVLCEIITRTDIPNENVKEANKFVNRYAKQNGWGREGNLSPSLTLDLPKTRGFKMPAIIVSLPKYIDQPRAYDYSIY